MDTKKIALIVGALVIAIAAAFGVNTMMRGSGSPQARAAASPKLNGPMVLVATRGLPMGTIITADSMRFQAWPEGLVEKDYFVKSTTDIQKLVGTVVRHTVTAGQPVTQGALVSPDDRGFLAAALGPGMRAVTVKVSAEQGVAGFVFPGDRVDVLLTQELEAGGELGTGTINTSETIIRNVRVLATDQRFTAQTPEGKTEVQVAGSVTLEATPAIAERIAVAQSMGKLSLALRPLSEGAGSIDSAIASGEITMPKGASGAQERAILREAAGRPIGQTATSTLAVQVSPVAARVAAARRAEALRKKAAEQGEQTGGAASAAQGSGNATAGVTGPVVRVVRGDKVTEIPVGGY